MEGCRLIIGTGRRDCSSGEEGWTLGGWGGGHVGGEWMGMVRQFTVRNDGAPGAGADGWGWGGELGKGPGGVCGWLHVMEAGEITDEKGRVVGRVSQSSEQGLLLLSPWTAASMW